MEPVRETGASRRMQWQIIGLLRNLTRLHNSSRANCATQTKAASRNYDGVRYDLDAEYNWQRSRLEASVCITLAPMKNGLEAIKLDDGAA